ncbi:MAG TPA: RES family NAD+ phosphorylase [Pseudolabrys sp.]|nr:RES family NAD+ phosphorylase [Pseudolabrys sp.]
MSSSIWTRDALSSEAAPARGTCWRVVEAQHHVSTAKLTDTAEEQTRLEELIEGSKPPIPVACRGLHYLLFTPFRYGAAYPKGSRFRRAGMTAGVYYASVRPETAMAELSFYRLLFFAESPATPWPANPGEYSAFSADYATELAIDLTRPPLDRDRATWTDKTDYSGCQSLADLAREAPIDLIKYQSVRCPDRGMNLAILDCAAFASHDIGSRQTWRIQLNASGVRLIRDHPKLVLNFDRDAFAGDPRIIGMTWER